MAVCFQGQYVLSHLGSDSSYDSFTDGGTVHQWLKMLNGKRGCVAYFLDEFYETSILDATTVDLLTSDMLPPLCGRAAFEGAQSFHRF